MKQNLSLSVHIYIYIYIYSYIRQVNLVRWVVICLTKLPSLFSLRTTTKSIKTQTNQKQLLMLLLISPPRLLSENCICAYLCMAGQPYRCSSVSFINLTAFFLLRKITFIISVSNTYWPGVSLWHIPAPHNHACLQLSIPHDLLTPFFIHCHFFLRWYVCRRRDTVKHRTKKRYNL